jgi:hypothetical protein
MSENTWAYPPQNIDPRRKNFAWILQYMKAAWSDSCNYMPAAMLFNRSQNRFWEIKQYVLGKQSISKYKKIQPGDEIQNNTELNNDSTVLAMIPKFIEIAKSKLLQKEYNLEAAAVDPMAKSEEDEYFNQMKIKIMMNNMLTQMQSPLAQSPLVKLKSNEPQDMEQLQMQMDFGYKHIMAMEAEEGMQLVFGQNRFEHQRTELVDNLYDFGIGGWKVWIDENGQVKFRAVCGENFISSYCLKSDFSDGNHAGEIIQVKVADLAPYFNAGQMEQICKVVAGKYGNPSSFDVRQNRWWDKFTVMVLDLQFCSWNSTVYESKIDKSGNERFGKTDFANMRFVGNSNPYSNMAYENDESQQIAEPTKNVLDDTMVGLVNDDVRGGMPKPIYMSSCEKVWYKGKWIIGTELMYDWGLKEEQASELSSWWNKKSDYIMGAPMFYKMQFTGISERLIVLADAYQLTWRKLQNLKNKLIPYLIELDLTSLENVGLGRGNDQMTPAQIIDFAFSNFILLKRSTDPYKNNPNYKSMDIQPTGMLEAFAQLYADLDRLYLMIQQVSGLNELTDGSTPNPKMLVPVADAAMQATNNALYLISNCERDLIERLGQLVVEKIQLAVQRGKVAGYAKALGSSTVKFFEINPDISLYELGIFITDNLSSEEKQMLLQEINIKDSQGLLTPADKLFLIKSKSITQAMVYLNYITKKRGDEAHQKQMALMQQQSMGNQQTAVAAEQMKQQTIMLQGKIQMEIESAKGQWLYITEQMKKSSDQQEAGIQAHAKVLSASITASAKQAAAQIG